MDKAQNTQKTVVNSSDYLLRLLKVNIFGLLLKFGRDKKHSMLFFEAPLCHIRIETLSSIFDLLHCFNCATACKTYSKVQSTGEIILRDQRYWSDITRFPKETNSHQWICVNLTSYLRTEFVVNKRKAYL